jgi:hypothetical protein
LEAIVAGIYASREGGLSYPLLTYVKLLLLEPCRKPQLFARARFSGEQQLGRPCPYG